MASTAIQTYVQGLYTNVLQRSGDTGGIDYWVSRADAGMSASAMAGSFIGSAEAQNVTAVLHLYDVFFNRTADSSGLSFWVNALKSGTSLLDIAKGFSASSEFQAKFASASSADYVEATYSNLFGRASDAAGKAFWIQKLDSGALTRAEVGLAFSLSPEALASTGAATRFVESYLVLRAAGTAEPSTSAVEALAAKSLDAALSAKITGYVSGASVAGKLVDGYLAGATVFADANGDGIWNEGEAKAVSDAKGNFSLDGAKGALVASGGTDLSTGKAFKGVLKAPEGASVVNPLTSLQQSFVAKGMSVADAEAKVAKALGLDASKFDLTTYDPLAAALDSNASAADRALAAQAQAQAAKIANFIVAAEKTLVGAAGGADKLDAASAGNALIDALANAIASDSDGVVSFTDTTMLQSVMNSAVTLTGDADLTAAAAKVEGLADEFAAMSAASASNIDKAVAAGGDVTALLANVAQAQVVAQGEMADKLGAAAESGDLAGVAASYTGDAFDKAADKAVVGDLDPNSDADDKAIDDSNKAADAADDTPTNGGGSGGSGGSPATFEVDVDSSGVVTFGGTATGNITLTGGTLLQAGATAGTLTFTRDGISVTSESITISNSFAIHLDASEVLHGSFNLIDGVPITGTGKVVISSGNGNGTTTWDAHRDYKFDEIAVTTDTTLVIGDLDNDIVLDAGVNLGHIKVEIESGASLTLSAAQVVGPTITGEGSVTVTGIASDSNLSGIQATGKITYEVTSNINLSGNQTPHWVNEIKVASGCTLTMTAEEADAKPQSDEHLTGANGRVLKITGAGNVIVNGWDGDQTIDVETTGNNVINGGKGLDKITLHGGHDTVVINAGVGPDASDSAIGYAAPLPAQTIDQITGFDLVNDKLQLSGGTGVLADGNYTVPYSGATSYEHTFTVANGLVTLSSYHTTGSDVLTGDGLIGDLLFALGNSKKSAAFQAVDGTFVVQGNGVTDQQYGDIVVKLVGTTVTNLSTILVADTTAPTATVTAAAIQSTGHAVVQSSEPGMAYLVKNDVTVTDVASITSAADAKWNSVAITNPGTPTNLDATGLPDGTYKVYTVDASGNLSSAATSSVTVDNTAPTFNAAGSTPADNGTDAAVAGNISLKFGENLSAANSDLSKVYLKDVATDSTVAASISISGDTVVINPTASLSEGTAYYVNWDAAALQDAVGNAVTAVSGETTFNFSTVNVLPTISAATVAADNSYIDITFSEAVYNTNGGTGALEATDLALTFTKGSGTATGASIASVTKVDGSALAGGETTIRVNLTLTGTPNGAEKIEIKAATDAIYDVLGGAAANTQSTGEKTLADQAAPTFNAAGSTPADDGTMSNSNDVVLKFSENLSAANSDLSKVYLKDVATDSTVAASISISGDTVVINPTASLSEGTAYYVNWDAAALKDAAGNAVAAVFDETTFNFSTVNVLPTISAATMAADNSYIDITFSEAVYNTSSGSGALEATDLALTFTQGAGTATNAVIASVTKADGSALAGGETVIRVNLTLTGTPNGAEKIEIKAATDAIYDVLGGAAANTQSTGEKTLADQAAPTFNAAGSTPADDATMSNGNDVVLKFGGNLSAANSDLTKVYLKDVATDSTVDAVISISGDTVVINPTANLAYGTAYYVNWDAAALKDAAGNAVAAVANETTFNFTTAYSHPVTNTSGSAQTVDASALDPALPNNSNYQLLNLNSTSKVIFENIGSRTVDVYGVNPGDTEIHVGASSVTSEFKLLLGGATGGGKIEVNDTNADWTHATVTAYPTSNEVGTINLSGLVSDESTHTITQLNIVAYADVAFGSDDSTVDITGFNTGGSATISVSGGAVNVRLNDLAGVVTTVTGSGFSGGITADAEFVGSSVSFTGGAGADVFKASTHGDTITGGAGADTLTGGGGADTFIYATGDASTLNFFSNNGGTSVQPVEGDNYSGLEVINNFAAVDKLTLGNAGLTGGNTGAISSNYAVEGNDYEFWFGQYNSSTGEFTVGDQSTPDATNGSAIVLWDGSAASGVQLEAVVLVGIDMAKTATLHANEITFA